MLLLLFVLLFLAGHLVHAVPQGYDILSCLSAAGVPQDYPGTDIFEEDSLGWNLRLNFTPVAIAYLTTFLRFKQLSCAPLNLVSRSIPNLAVTQTLLCGSQ
jgi:hypothetical protein